MSRFHSLIQRRWQRYVSVLQITNFLPVGFQGLLEADGHPQIKAEERMNFIVIASQAGLVQV